MAIDREIAEDFAALGVQIEDDKVVDEDGDAFKAWDTNQEPLWLFLSLQTQWRAVASMAGVFWIGLDYGAADILMRTHSLGKKMRRRMFEELQLMERAALDAFAEHRDEAR